MELQSIKTRILRNKITYWITLMANQITGKKNFNWRAKQ